MTRWKALPAGLDPAVVQFVGELRRLKDDSGLTHRRLAARTGYSASSWERYLGGRLLPPGGAVEALAALAGADPVRLLARHEAATEAWRRDTPASPFPDQGQGQGQGQEPEPPTADEGSTGPGSPDPDSPESSDAAVSSAGTGSEAGDRQRLRLVLTAVVSAAVGAAISGLIVGSVTGRPTTSAVRPVASVHPAALVPSQVPYTCAYVRRNGLWYAGNSSTLTATVVVYDTGPEVAELQCLLRRIHISPGGVDGNFGPLTSYAVIQAQKTLHLDVDGQVGPKTWAALRG